MEINSTNQVWLFKMSLFFEGILKMAVHCSSLIVKESLSDLKNGFNERNTRFHLALNCR